MPGQYYLFVPFTASEMVKVLPDELTVKKIAMTWRNDATELTVGALKTPTIIYYQETAPGGWQGGSFDPLNDTIYIIGHCHKGGQHLSSSRGGFRFDRAELDAQTLVNRVLEYVPTTMVNFKLFACFGGAIYENGAAPDGSFLFQQSFAQGFYSRLKRSYRAAILTAYLLPVMGGLDPQGHKRLATEDGRGHWGRASGNAITFGA